MQSCKQYNNMIRVRYYARSGVPNTYYDDLGHGPCTTAITKQSKNDY